VIATSNLKVLPLTLSFVCDYFPSKSLSLGVIRGPGRSANWKMHRPKQERGMVKYFVRLQTARCIGKMDPLTFERDLQFG
jgi:hypothetical protein